METDFEDLTEYLNEHDYLAELRETEEYIKYLEDSECGNSRQGDWRDL
jgi:hypothetical protein